MDAQDWLPWQRPVPWLVAVLLLAAAAFLLLPRSPSPDDAAATQLMPPVDAAASALLPDSVGQAAAAAASAASAAEAAALAPEPAASAATTATTATALPAQFAATAEPAAVSPASPDALSVRGLQATWVQVNDAKGRNLLARTVAKGETVVVDGVLPLKVRIGNVVGTELGFRGKTVDLTPVDRNNMANLSLP